LDDDQFMTIVQQRAGLDRTGAERATRATLETLSQLLPQERLEDLRFWLPEPVQQWVTPGPVVRFDVHEFLRRVAAREEIDVSTVERHVRAVFHALGHALPPMALTALATELPRQFWPLVDHAARGRVEYMPADEFLRRVAERSGLDLEAARRATDAVLETLAARISGRDVDHLIGELSIELHPPLWRGREKSHGASGPVSLDEFLELVAEREGVLREEPRDHTRAVLATLREAIPDKEFSRLTAHLPSGFEPLLMTR
jgi:uncharacterized protein (DUF2267 family)